MMPSEEYASPNVGEVLTATGATTSAWVPRTGVGWGLAATRPFAQPASGTAVTAVTNVPGAIGEHAFPAESVHLTKIILPYAFTLEEITCQLLTSTTEAREFGAALLNEKGEKLTSATATVAANASGLITVAPAAFTVAPGTAYWVAIGTPKTMNLVAHVMKWQVNQLYSGTVEPECEKMLIIYKDSYEKGKIPATVPVNGGGFEESELCPVFRLTGKA